MFYIITCEYSMENKINYFNILDSIISSLKIRFSTESLKIEITIYLFMKLEYNESSAFI